MSITSETTATIATADGSSVAHGEIATAMIEETTHMRMPRLHLVLHPLPHRRQEVHLLRRMQRHRR